MTIDDLDPALKNRAVFIIGSGFNISMEAAIKLAEAEQHCLIYTGSYVDLTPLLIDHKKKGINFEDLIKELQPIMTPKNEPSKFFVNSKRNYRK